MLNALRKPIIPILLLLMMATTSSVDLCHHEQESPSAPPEIGMTLLAAASCDGCCDDSHGDKHDGACHSCACFCHSSAILAAPGGSDTTGNAGSLILALATQDISDFKASFDRPPLRS